MKSSDSTNRREAKAVKAWETPKLEALNLITGTQGGGNTADDAEGPRS